MFTESSDDDKIVEYKWQELKGPLAFILTSEINGLKFQICLDEFPTNFHISTQTNFT